MASRYQINLRRYFSQMTRESELVLGLFQVYKKSKYDIRNFVKKQFEIIYSGEDAEKILDWYMNWYEHTQFGGGLIEKIVFFLSTYFKVW